MGEVSASGLPGETGILVLDVPQASRAAAAGLRKGDVVLRLDGKPADTLRDLQRLSADSLSFGTVNITIWRGQREITLVAEAPVRVEMFKAPNHVELGNPATGWGSSNVLPRRRLAQSPPRVQACARFKSRSSITSEYFERKT